MQHFHYTFEDCQHEEDLRIKMGFLIAKNSKNFEFIKSKSPVYADLVIWLQGAYEHLCMKEDFEKMNEEIR